MTSLMGAAYSGNPEIVEFLIDQGAAVNVINHLGGTAYSIAKFKRSKEVLDLLAPHYSPEHRPGPYRLAIDLIYNAIVKKIRYYNYKFRYYTGLVPFELNEEL